LGKVLVSREAVVLEDTSFRKLLDGHEFVPTSSIVVLFPFHHLTHALSASDGVLEAVVARIFPDIIHKPVIDRLQNSIKEPVFNIRRGWQVLGRVAAMPERTARISRLKSSNGSRHGGIKIAHKVGTVGLGKGSYLLNVVSFYSEGVHLHLMAGCIASGVPEDGFLKSVVVDEPELGVT
jgi:hypothetical protein